ncbi:MAG: hypothetical protein RL653_428 [Pseudomonadota bacterium]|jgi:hypothetical protein
MRLHALVAVLVLPGCNKERSTPPDERSVPAKAPRPAFPIEVVSKWMGEPGGAVSDTPPEDCQPEVFDPSRAGARRADGPASVRRVALAPPFAMTEYLFDCGSTGSSVLEVSRNGARHALYTHVGWDWKLSPDKRTLVMRNVVAVEGGKWEDRFRAIDIATKKAVALQDGVRCAAYLQGFSGSRFVSTSGVDHEHTPEACAWDIGSGLLARMRVDGLEFSGGASDAPANALELLPAEPTGVYLLATVSGEGEAFDCELVALDWEDSSRRYRRKLGVKLEGMSCHRAAESVELDLSVFTFERPTFRYRVVQQQGAKGRWQAVQ